MVAEDSRYHINQKRSKPQLIVARLTLHILHFQTKLASPLLPLISFISYFDLGQDSS